MVNATTYKATIVGMSIVIVACFGGFLFSRKDINSLNSTLDQARLKHEALLAEKLLIEKSRDKNQSQVGSLKAENVNLNTALYDKTQMITVQIAQNKKLKNDFNYVTQRDARLIEELKENLKLKEDLVRIFEQNKIIKSDSLNLLSQQVSFLKLQLNEAIIRSIDQTLVIAEKRNDKITSKAKRARELLANVDVPGELSDLSFIVEGPDGSALSSEYGTITSRQLVSETATASLQNTLPVTLRNKKMEIVYKPNQNFKPGTYTFKIYNGTEYVGSMQAKLR